MSDAPQPLRSEIVKRIFAEITAAMEKDMMNGDEMGSMTGLGMGFGWLFGLLVLVLLVLSIAALIKYLRK